MDGKNVEVRDFEDIKIQGGLDTFRVITQVSTKDPNGLLKTLLFDARGSLPMKVWH